MKFRTIAIISVFLACASIGNAGLINCNVDSTMQDQHVTWSSGSYNFYSVLVIGDQSESPGTALVDLTLDSTGDPDIWQGYKIKNNTNFIWTNYHVDVWMDDFFTISDAGVDTPTSGWTVDSTLPIDSTYDSIDNRYEATIDYSGTPIQIHDTFQFNYTISYIGSEDENVDYGQKLTPTPEPGALFLLVCGVAGLLAVRRRFA